MRHSLPVLVGLMSAGLCPAQEAPTDPLERAMENPTSTGLLVLEVVPDSQAARGGVAPGDIIVAYAGKPIATREDLIAAIGDPAVPEPIRLEVDRGGESRTFEVGRGKVGVAVLPVKKGERLDPLPPATDVSFDFSRLEKAGEAWYAFTENGKSKMGFEYFRWRVEGLGPEARAILDGEVAFDGGEELGRRHFVATVVASMGQRPQGRTCRFESVLTNDVAEGSVVFDPKAPTAGWETLLKPREGEIQTVRSLAAGDLVPAYFIYALARCMPQETKACYRFTPVNEASGTLGKASALVVLGQEPIQVADREVATWKIAWVSMGRTMNTHWVDADGNVLATDYGGASGALATKEEALANLHPDLRPRIAGHE